MPSSEIPSSIDSALSLRHSCDLMVPANGREYLSII